MSDTINIIFDSQILNAVQACAEKTRLNFRLNLILPNKATPLEEGDLIHQMFEHYNKGLIAGNNQELIYDNARWNALVAESEALGEAASITMSLSPAEASEIIYQFKEYVTHFRMDGVRVLEAERPFIKELYSDDQIRIFYTGKIDRMTDTPNFGVVPRDYKSGRRREAPEPLSNQFTGYAWATGSRVMIVDKVGFQKTLKPEERFNIYPLLYPPSAIKEWIEDTIWWGKQYAFFIETNTWPRNRTSCDKYGGCTYIPVCKASEEARAMVMQNEFIIGDDWDPTAVLRRGK
jgi:hypothetical protein